MGCIPPLCGMLALGDAKVINVALEAIDNILAAGVPHASAHNGTNPYAQIIEECGGIDKLESLQRHDNQAIYQRAFDILKTYFDAVDATQDAEVTDSSSPSAPPPPPSTAAPGSSFAFAPSSATTFRF